MYCTGGLIRFSTILVEKNTKLAGKIYTLIKKIVITWPSIGKTIHFGTIKELNVDTFC